MITQTFESASSDAIYTAQLDPATGKSSCSCPAWRFKKGDKPRTCKHVRELEASHPFNLLGEFTPVSSEPTPSTPPQVAPSTTTAQPVKPMLAVAMTTKTIAETLATVDRLYASDAWRIEEKYDGFRVQIHKRGATITVWSRPKAGHAPLVTDLPAHVMIEVATLPDGIYDGEKWIPGGRSWDVGRLDRQQDIVLVIFDVLEVLGQPTAALPYLERRAMLEMVVRHAGPDIHGGVVRMPVSGPVSAATVQAIWDRRGEGAMIKRAASTYQPGRRSTDWVKVKKLSAAVLTIVGFEAGKLGPYAVTLLRGDDGQAARVGTLDNATRAAIAADPDRFIGRRLVIHYTELTDDGSYRHPMFDHFAGEGE